MKSFGFIQFKFKNPPKKIFVFKYFFIIKSYNLNISPRYSCPIFQYIQHFSLSSVSIFGGNFIIPIVLWDMFSIMKLVSITPSSRGMSQHMFFVLFFKTSPFYFLPLLCTIDGLQMKFRICSAGVPKTQPNTTTIYHCQ